MATATRAGFTAGRSARLASGWDGVCGRVADEWAVADTPERRVVWDAAVGYFAKHRRRLDYRARLAEGRSIGSGLVEGTITTWGPRRKARGARWLERDVERMAGLVALSHRTLWEQDGSLAA